MLRGLVFVFLALIGTLTSAIAADEPPTVDVAHIINRSEAQKILGEPVRTPTPLNLTTKDGYDSKCNYYSAKSSRALLLRLHQAAEGSTDPQTEFDQIAANSVLMRPVKGVGDKAGMLAGIPQNGLPPNVVILYVVKGNWFITVGLAGFTKEESALEKAQSAANKILAQL